MARPAFKRVWTRIVPAAAERSTYVMLSGLGLALIIAFWRPIPVTLWLVDEPVLAIALYALGLGGFAFTFYATFLIDHFDLMGLRQVWCAFKDRPYTEPALRQPSVYKRIRHPIQTGVLIGVWVTPSMTGGHLALAAIITLYILIGIAFEERDLIRRFGAAYVRYREQTGAFFPIPGRRVSSHRQPQPGPAE